MRILIVDDHAIVRRGLAYVVTERFPDADVVEAEGALAALDAMRTTAADLALVDVRMPGLDGLELLRAMKLEWPSVPVIMLSTYENPEYVRRALFDGAAGYLLKGATPEELGQAIDVAISGDGRAVSANLIWTLFGSVMNSGVVDSELTRRERDILALLSEGRSNRSIAQHLYLSDKTVKAHLAAIFRKLGVTNRTQAAMMARRLGLGPVPGAVSGRDQGRS
jgi:DNA-binding NarL/FixJ family response regulator